jgi:hypothetical protein
MILHEHDCSKACSSPEIDGLEPISGREIVDETSVTGYEYQGAASSPLGLLREERGEGQAGSGNLSPACDEAVGSLPDLSCLVAYGIDRIWPDSG